jgi:streptogramin lyase
MTRAAGRCLIRLGIAAAIAATFGGHAGPARAAPALQVIATVGGQPDDITVDGRGHLLWGDLSSGTLRRLSGRSVVTVARGLSIPEGVIAPGKGVIVVAEQGRDQIVRIDRKGRRTVLYQLRPVPGQEGVDGIGRDPRSGALLVPDSPRGTVLRMSADGKNVGVIARGLGRPVDAAVDSRGNVLVPDEHLGTLVQIGKNGHISYHGRLSTPDDVAVARNGTVWITTLGDGGLWEMRAGGVPHRVLGGLANPQGLTLDRCGDPIVVDQNSGRIVRYALTAAGRRCPL